MVCKHKFAGSAGSGTTIGSFCDFPSIFRMLASTVRFHRCKASTRYFAISKVYGVLWA